MQRKSRWINCPHCKRQYKNTCALACCGILRGGLTRRRVCKVCKAKGKVFIRASWIRCTHCNDWKNRCDCDSCGKPRFRQPDRLDKGICTVCNGAGWVPPGDEEV